MNIVEEHSKYNTQLNEQKCWFIIPGFNWIGECNQPIQPLKKNAVIFLPENVDSYISVGEATLSRTAAVTW